MINQVTLVGRVVEDPVLKTLEDGRTVTKVRIAIQRSFKNSETLEYESDFITCTIWAGLAEATTQYCKKGAIIGVRGKLQNNVFIYQDERKFHYNDVVVDKISFISGSSK